MKRLAGSRGPNRIRAVDPLRGFAMVLVIAQHAYHLVDPARVIPTLNVLIYAVTRIASVAFMCVSGMMIGYFLYSGRSADEVIHRYRRRALFLLVFAHPAIHLASFFGPPEDRLGVLWTRILTELTITDTIAICLLIAPLLLLRLRRRAIVVLSLVSLVASAAMMGLWLPKSDLGLSLKIFFFGGMFDEPRPIDVDWPVLPWLAIFLCGSLAGRLLADTQAGRIAPEQLLRRLLRAAAFLTPIGLAYGVAYKLLRLGFDGVIAESIFVSIYPDRTTGLLPLYFAVLCSILAFLLWRLDLRGRADRITWALSVMGRTSLFTYVTQFFFVFSVPGLLGWKGHLGLPGVALVAGWTLVATWILAYGYGRARGWIPADDYRDFAATAGDSPLTRVERPTS